MNGFFVERKNPHATRNDTSNKQNKKPSCLTCGLKKTCASKRMEPFGNANGSFLIVYGTVSKAEDIRGSLKMDSEWKRISFALKKAGVVPRECLFVRACRCHTPAPTEKQLVSCSEHLYSVLKKGDFTNVILIGSQAVVAYFSYQNNKHATFSKLRGLTIPDTTFGCYVTIVQDPPSDSSSRDDLDQIKTTLFESDIHGIRPFIRKTPPKAFSTIRSRIHPCTEQEAVAKMELVLKGQFTDFIAFDYETTGLRPYNKGHKIVCCGIATSKKNCFSFMLTKNTIPILKKILRDPKIPKVAANIKFEKTWSRVCLNCSINNWYLDTVISAHVIDNRRGITSVKFQSFALFGIYGYENAVGQYITSTAEEEKEKGTNAFNSMDKCPKEIILKYVAMDSLLEYWIAVKHSKEVK